MDWFKQTIATYDHSAKEMAEYYDTKGPRIADIELALKLAGAGNNANVIEIGCGDGRDASEIIKRVGWYEGFDPSIGMLKLAQTKSPSTSFVQANALSYKYPPNTDVIFAFASLLHLDKTNLQKVFELTSTSIRSGGIFFISLKEKPQYDEKVKGDKFGLRMFYYYNPEIIKQMTSNYFTSVFEDHQQIGEEYWFTIALKKL